MPSRRRTVQRVVAPEPVVEGAGVRLKRSLGTPTVSYLDPFLLLDHFASTDPDDYRAGFPLHPHRGIETVTYVLTGVVSHRDTLGNAGRIGAGDVQWMTAGRGIMHEEMPEVRPEGIAGLQLWVNLPAKLKMTAPRYQDIRSADIPEAKTADGAVVRVIAGTVDGVTGPVKGIAADPVYLDVSVPSGSAWTRAIDLGHTAFAYLLDGAARFGADGRAAAPTTGPALIVWGDGDHVTVETGDEPARFVLISGRPLHEPIARYGPFVMNTREEIEQALADLRQGTFV
jgi:redox-sensitive bicupin YhaK (pirin superfamily)